MSSTPSGRLILASTSPRRRELIRNLGLPYEVMASEADETIEDGLTPGQIVETLSERKARAVYERLPAGPPRQIVVGSDTIVVYNGRVLGKPEDRNDARRMLQMLQGSTHQVYTGIACIETGTGKSLIAHRMTKVVIKPLTESQIDHYIATGEPMDKAGSYAIQGIGATMVESIEGDYFNVVGLSLNLLSDMLQSFDIDVL
ncbi:nucleoside triphosphate pyrophosphatase [Paenibacillus sp. J2TS4]|uniref:Maf family protein n=1 Tax=Paenibacillus sp. J2TS4 TaxID=2807194 RepID=UPI001B28652D|nr:Maf family protein [Paenibacillus sp. J2TS4]GIP31361.1 Maf-like protein [Paenibacillus sp. J2TS4]